MSHAPPPVPPPVISAARIAAHAARAARAARAAAVPAVADRLARLVLSASPPPSPRLRPLPLLPAWKESVPPLSLDGE